MPMDPAAKAKFDALMESMEDLTDLDKILRCMIFGIPGVGKTILAMQIAQLITPPDKIIAYVDSDTSFNVLTNKKWRDAGLPNRTKRFRFNDYDQIKTLSQVVTARRSDLPIACVVLDESSSMQDKDLTAVHDEHVRLNVAEVNKYVPGWTQYRTEKNRFSSLMASLFDAQVHVIQVAHRRVDVDVAKRQIISPDFLPGVQKILLKPLTLSVYMNAEVEDRGSDKPAEYYRKVQLHPTNLITGPKCKIDDMPVTCEPSFLLKAIGEWLAGSRGTNDKDNLFTDPIVEQSDPGIIEVE